MDFERAFEAIEGRLAQLDIEPDPIPEKRPGRDRVRGAVARIVRHFAKASDHLAPVFGSDTAVADALRARVDALRDASHSDLGERAARVCALASWLSCACEAIELEAESAALLRVDLGVIVRECDLIAAGTSETLAAAA